MKKHGAIIKLEIGLLCAVLFFLTIAFPSNAVGADIGLNTHDNTSLHSDIMNPMMFGATGDGKTDDTIAIQKAIDYCVENKNCCTGWIKQYISRQRPDSGSKGNINLVDFGRCENLICCNNYSENSELDTFVYDCVRFPLVENNLYSE